MPERPYWENWTIADVRSEGLDGWKDLLFWVKLDNCRSGCAGPQQQAHGREMTAAHPVA